MLFLRWISCITILTLGACGLFSKATDKNSMKIHPGMTATQMTDLMGEPKNKIPKGNFVIWKYDVVYSEGAHSYPYNATFENDVLKAWDFAAMDVNQLPDIPKAAPAAPPKKAAAPPSHP